MFSESDERNREQGTGNREQGTGDQNGFAETGSFGPCAGRRATRVGRPVRGVGAADGVGRGDDVVDTASGGMATEAAAEGGLGGTSAAMAGFGSVTAGAVAVSGERV